MIAIPLGEWTGLEVVRLVLQALTPIAVFLLGYLVTRESRRLDEVRWARQKLIEERIKVYGEVAQQLNDIYCYYLFIGPWKTLSPPDIIDRKRKCDAKLHTSRAYFSGQLFENYLAFIQMCFLEYSGEGKDAKIRARVKSHLGDRKTAWEATRKEVWPSDWDDKFVHPDDAPSENLVRSAYEKMLHAFHCELIMWDFQRPRNRDRED
jgi:hypothetical protein